MPTREFKASDLRLTDNVPVQFTEFQQNQETGTSQAKVSLVCRTNSVVESWWGGLVHELSGMFHKDSVPLDWRHDPNELVGYLDEFKSSSEKIECSGRVISTSPDDRAATIMKQARAGVPFESSIFFGGQGLEVEEVPEQKEVSVNGKPFTGPGFVFRKWPLRGVALCPYGADNQTSVNLALKGDTETFTAIILSESKEKTMSVGTEETRTNEELEQEATTQVKTELTEPKEEELTIKGPVSPDGLSGKDFVDAFGQDGAMWFAEGRTFPQATQLYIAKLEARVTELETRLAALRKEAGAAESLDANDVDHSDAYAAKVKKLEKAIGPRLAAFAAGMKLPGR